MIASNQTNREEQFDKHDKLQRMQEGAEQEGWVYLAYVEVPLEEVGDAKDVVDHGVPVAEGVEDGRAICAAEFHRRSFSVCCVAVSTQPCAGRGSQLRRHQKE